MKKILLLVILFTIIGIMIFSNLVFALASCITEADCKAKLSECNAHECTCYNNLCYPGLVSGNPPENCKKEGEQISQLETDIPCCSGLKKILPKFDGILSIDGICTAKCGNGVCNSLTETNYNCPVDCKSSVSCIKEGEQCEIVGNSINVVSCCDGLSCKLIQTDLPQPAIYKCTKEIKNTNCAKKGEYCEPMPGSFEMSVECCSGLKCVHKDPNDRGYCEIGLIEDEKVKILPETASLKARERLGRNWFNVTLKEVGQDKKLVYELSGEKEGKFLGLFKVKGKVYAEIDSETGEVIKIMKPWWAFLVIGI